MGWYAICLALLMGVLVCRPGEERPPHVIVVSIDTLNRDALPAFEGSTPPLPILDAFAGESIRFVNAYSTASWTLPAHASLLTGLYPHQAGVGHMMGDRGVDGYRGNLNTHCMTIAEVLKTAGYSTYMAGKWHVTKEINPASDADRFNWPCQRGFTVSSAPSMEQAVCGTPTR